MSAHSVGSRVILDTSAYVTVGVSFVADYDGTYVVCFCNQQQVYEETIIGKSLQFGLINFEIGNTLTGKLKEFKIYEVALGAESFMHSTNSNISLILQLVHLPAAQDKALTPSLDLVLRVMHFTLNALLL